MNTNVSYRISYNKSSKDALEELKEWLQYGNVVVGPLNMEELNYLYYPQLYRNLDHYLVVQRYENNRIYLLDSEGITSIFLDEKEFVKAWKGDKIIEGRGKYIMRQLFKSISIDISKIDLDKLYQYIIDNLSKAQKNSAYKKLINMDIKSSFYLVNGLAYAIPNRLQKLYLQKEFFKDKNLVIISIINRQIEVFNNIFCQFLEDKNNFNLNALIEIDNLENLLLKEMKELRK